MLRRITQSTIGKLQQPRQLTGKYFSATAAVPATKEKWDLYAGVLVERVPVVSKTLNPLERQFQDFLWGVELEKSLKSNHELQHERDLLQAELIKKGEVEIDLEEASSKQTAQDLKDAYVEELKKFKAASRTTADDAGNSVISTKRRLEESLYLLLEHQLGQQKHFLLPQGPRNDGETLRQTAERVLREKCGDEIQVNFYGNAPCGFYKYKYPKTLREQSVGAKVFFYRVTLQKGNVNKALGNKFEWLVKEALNKKLKNKEYAESISKFIL